ncbi:hypothetical protein Mal4_15100 [Maioricimonas rarisocia]|uniref:Uncharacterized protein n=1 Tax=Maioricimonas rarisocia TaxID=2528026 RepID=A0A517Z409_9PLAN|nr:hypothetical protein [Maioricimonas rarisocia]QDU37201.1 hypothetical protein Mal4_15100 [Maioricimonas rarisocia]
MSGWRVHREMLDGLLRRCPSPGDSRVLLGVGALSVTAVFALSTRDYDVADESNQPQPGLLHELQTEDFPAATEAVELVAQEPARPSGSTPLIRQPRTTPDGPLLPPPMPGTEAEQASIVRVGFETDDADQDRTSNTVWLTGEIETMDE